MGLNAPNVSDKKTPYHDQLKFSSFITYSSSYPFITYFTLTWNICPLIQPSDALWKVNVKDFGWSLLVFACLISVSFIFTFSPSSCFYFCSCAYLTTFDQCYPSCFHQRSHSMSCLLQFSVLCASRNWLCS